MNMDLERQEHDRPQDIDELIFGQDARQQFSQR